MWPARALAAAQLTCSASSLRYGSVVVGRSEELLVVLTNSGKESIAIASITAEIGEYSVVGLKLPRVLAAGERLDVPVTFAPKTEGSASGQVRFVSDASNPILDLAVSGVGVSSETVTATPARISFLYVTLGASSTVPVVLTNMTKREITLSSLLTTAGAFSVAGARFPLTLEPGHSVNLKATFKPQAAGLVTGSAFVFGPGLNIPLTGTGTGEAKPELKISPSTLNFDDAAIGTTETQTLVLTATGGSVTVTSASSSNSQFAAARGVFPLTIPVGQEVSLDVAFTPKDSGKASATLSFDTKAEGSKAEALAGTGTAPFVSLSWDASPSDVAGYNIYRKTSANGSFTKINPNLDPDTHYTDATAAGGKTYYYATTAVNSRGKESGYSNRAEVAVP